MRPGFLFLTAPCSLSIAIEASAVAVCIAVKTTRRP
jgi:hypothetical protein